MDALFIIAKQGFRDEELFYTKEELEKSGIAVTVASKKTGTITGSRGGKATAEKALADVNVSAYDAVIFVGGNGSEVYYTDQQALKIAKDSIAKNKILAAICIAPGILAHAGVLNGKSATIWDSGDGSYSSILEDNGASYTGEDVTIDGKIITANGPDAARKFGQAIANML